MGELVGYLRVSTKDQKLHLQRDALLAAGVQEGYLYQDVASGATPARPGLEACLKALRPGDTLVVWKLDRLARSLVHLLKIVQDLEQRHIGFRILEGAEACLDTTTSTGKLFLGLLGLFAEFERNVIRERVVAGLIAARERGHRGGRRPKLSAAQQREAQFLASGGMKKTEIAAKFQCSRHTIYAALAQAPREASEAAD
jgi:DNA invertase Pin-like site-specific DNA recombinase